MKKKIINYLLKKYSKEFWKLSENISERFYKKDSAKYDILCEKLYYWITSGIKEF